jgi:hypothetical protein
MALLTLYASGLAATALAALQLAAWLALGLLLVRGRGTGEQLPAALLLGAALASALAALLVAAGQLTVAVALPALLGLAALVWSRRQVVAAAAHLAALYRTLIAGSRAWGVALGGLGLIYWLIALAPPRDADVLRYHLAHLRQIAQDGAWLPIADYHYALPFGWSLGFLPFELLGLPQAAQMLNLGLLTIAAALLFGLLRDLVELQVARLLTLLFVAHTAVLHMATTARADMQLVFVVLALTALSVRLRPGDLWGAGLLGLVAWIGAQSRYQAVALGLAGAVVLLVALARRRAEPRQLLAFAGGGAVALALSVPFYLFNWIHLGNPVWPLLTSVFNQPPGYAELVVNAYSRSLNGAMGLDTVAGGLWRLVTSPTVFPVPLAALLLLLVALRWRTHATAAAATFTVAFLALWVLAQPRLYPRFSMLLFVPALVGWGPVLGSWSRPGLPRIAVHGGLAALLALFVGLNVVYAYDYLEYAVTGNATRFHEHTWFKRTYDWVNTETPADARALVVVTSAQTYYLEREHRRVDPRFSGALDWTSVSGAPDLAARMRTGGFTLLIYEPIETWARYPGGEQMIAAVEAAQAEGSLREIARFDERLSTSRLLGDGYETQVQVLELMP